MPAKRSPKKSRKAAPAPPVAEVTPVDLDALVVAPSAPVIPPAVPPVDAPPPPRTGPPVRGAAGFAGGRDQRAGQTRRYAFRRS